MAGNTRLAITASTGIALFPNHGAGISLLLAGVDSAMYEAKRRGGSSYVCQPARGTGAPGSG